MTFKEILKGLLGAWKIPYLYFCAWRTWRTQRRNLTTWGRNYNLEPPRFDESNAQYRKRVVDKINNAGRYMTLREPGEILTERKQLEKWGELFNVVPMKDESTEDFRKRVLAAHPWNRPTRGIRHVLKQPQRMNHPISSMALELHKQNEAIAKEWEENGGIVERVDDSIILKHAGPRCYTCNCVLTVIDKKCFNSDCPEYMKVQR